MIAATTISHGAEIVSLEKTEVTKRRPRRLANRGAALCAADGEEMDRYEPAHHSKAGSYRSIFSPSPGRPKAGHRGSFGGGIFLQLSGLR